MSYILDALRRADAERERGAVPGLSSQQHAYVEDDAATPQRPRALVWAVVALAAALVVAVTWHFVGGPTTPRPIVEGSVSTAPPAAQVPLPTTPTAMVPPPAPALPPQPAVLPTPASVEPDGAATPPSPPPRAAAKRAPEPKHVAARNGDAEASPQPNAVTANAMAPNAATPKGADARAAGQRSARTPSDGRVYQQSELPDDVRRDLPKLVIGGASYSGDAASRMVMINGQIFHEGDQLAPQLVLERIKLKSAVLSYKGYRYEVTF
jgi:general secretion pathway protein B